jgi:hypothetical protein
MRGSTNVSRTATAGVTMNTSSRDECRRSCPWWDGPWCQGGEIDVGIGTTNLVWHIVVGGPVVQPAFAVEEVAEAVGAPRHQLDDEAEGVVVSPHVVRVFRPVVELADDADGRRARLGRNPKLDEDLARPQRALAQ